MCDCWSEKHSVQSCRADHRLGYSSRESGDECTEVTLALFVILVGLCVGIGNTWVRAFFECQQAMSGYHNLWCRNLVIKINERFGEE